MNISSINLLLRFFITITTSCFLSAYAFAQGPWVQKKHTGFVQIQTTLQAQGTYDGLIVNEVRITDTETNINREVASSDVGIYAIYGLTDKLTLFTHLPFKYVATKEQTDSLYHPTLLEEGRLFGLSNYQAGIKYRVLDNKLKVAVSLQSSWNTASQDLEKGITTGYLANSFGIFGHVGGSFASRWYSFLDLGYNVSTHEYSDFVNANVELGFQAVKTKSLWIVLNVNIRESLENGDFVNENLLQTGLYPNDQEWKGYGIKIFYELKNHIGFTLGTAGAFSANYVGFAGPLTFGIFKKW
ncbi:MAG: hypothetical protein AAF587_27500 [Bacteroidota bacterium]